MALTEKLTAIADAIRYKTGGSNQMTLPQMAQTIRYLPTDGAVDENAALVLIDWDGTPLRSYTRAEALALNALPYASALPPYRNVDHELLSFQGWNWTLAAIKSFLQNRPLGSLIVGAVYTTTDNADHNLFRVTRTTARGFMVTHKRATATVNNSAFDSCLCLEHINLPDGVSSIGNSAFISCYGLESITLPKDVTTVGTGAFYNCYRLTRVALPAGLTSIGQNGFRGCYNLSGITLPDGLTSLGDACFYNCTSLRHVALPAGLTAIGDDTFRVCSRMTGISIPASVASIGANAFYSCRSLLDIVLEGKPSLANTNAFGSGAYAMKIYVPRANLSWFENHADWGALYGKFAAIEDHLDYLTQQGFDVSAYGEAA